MSDMTDASGQMPRRNPRVSDGGAPVSGALAIALALVAVIAGFFILRSITDDGEKTLDFPADEQTSSDGDQAVQPENSDPGASSSVPSLVTEPTTPPIVTEGASVLVANANGTGGSAGSMRDALELGPGFTMAGAVDASSSVGQLPASVVYYVTDVPAAQQVAESLVTVLGGDIAAEPMPATGPPTTSGGLDGAGVLLMLGTDKAGKTLAELNPETATGTPVVTSPPIAGNTTTTVAG